jgi:hypothetical protein
MRNEGAPSVWVLADNQGAEEVPRGVRLERGGENDQGILMERPAVITDASP